MTIEYNKVTWYSKLLAVVIFVATFFIGFCFGQQYEEIQLSSVAPTTYTEKEVVTPRPNQALGVRGSDVVSDVIFSCPDGKNIHATFRTSQKVDLELSDGRSMTLPQVISASGARYANTDESFVFWNKGDGAFVEEHGTTTFKDCAMRPSGRQ